MVFDCDGQYHGGFRARYIKGTADLMVSDALTILAKFSNQFGSLVWFFSELGRIHLFFEGHRILIRRGAGWHLQADTLNRAVDELGRLHHVTGPAIREVIHLAFELSHRGHGAIFTLGDHTKVLTMSDPPRAPFVEMPPIKLERDNAEEIIALAAQDGATIITSDGTLVQARVMLRPSHSITIFEEERGVGARHSTAHRVSAATNALVIVVSVEGRITAYSKGSIKFKMIG